MDIIIIKYSRCITFFSSVHNLFISFFVLYLLYFSNSMALASDDEVSGNKTDEVNMPSSDIEEVEHIDDEEEKQPLTPEEKLPSLENELMRNVEND